MVVADEDATGLDGRGNYGAVRAGAEAVAGKYFFGGGGEDCAAVANMVDKSIDFFRSIVFLCHNSSEFLEGVFVCE